MDRRKFYDKQLVEDDDLNAEVTNTYNAIGALMSDTGIFGVISGGDITEQGVPSMSVDLSTPFIGYDQDGERIYKATGDVVDCSLDYLGNPTVPTVPGESVWISIHARFDYTLEDPKVIDGTTQYLTWAESYEWRVVAGVPAGGGGHVKPAKPADALLLADIELTFGQVSILTADIDESRKDAFVYTTAAGIGVDGSMFTKLSVLIDDVQEALDAIDAYLISRNGTGYIDQDLLPTGGEDIGDGTHYWGDIYCKSILNAGLGTETVGLTGTPYSAGFFEDLEIQNSIYFSPTRTVTKRKIPFGCIGSFLASAYTWGVSATIGARNIAGYLFCGTGAQDAMHIPLVDLPNGVSLKECFITWFEGTTNTSTARLYRRNNIGVVSSMGPISTKTTANAWDNEQSVALTAPEVIDLDTYDYYILVTAPAAATPFYVVAASMTYDVFDIGVAAS